MTTLYLNRCRTSRSFRKEESLWEDEIGRIFKLIDQHIRGLDSLSATEDDNYRRTLLSIALYGTYGSGKSSLLQTLVSRINDKGYKRENKHESDIYALPVIEPTLMPGNVQFLYAFLSTALLGSSWPITAFGNISRNCTRSFKPCSTTRVNDT